MACPWPGPRRDPLPLGAGLLIRRRRITPIRVSTSGLTDGREGKSNRFEYHFIRDRPCSIWERGIKLSRSPICPKCLSFDKRAIDPGWIGAKLRQISDCLEPRGDFLAWVPGEVRRQANYPSTVAYIAALVLHRYAMLGILDAAGNPMPLS
jgi:hypothetical protein